MTLLAQMAVQGAVGFAIGAGTNDLAIRWVFNALFTKKKRLIAENAKEVICNELMTAEKIVAKLTSPEVRASLERDVRSRLDAFDGRAKSLLGVLGRGFGPVLPELVKEEIRALARVADLFDEDLRSTVARICANQMTLFISGHLPQLIRETDIWNIVYETIMSYDERKLVSLTRQVANRELRGVTLWGGVIGAVVGVAMSLVMWMLE